MARVITTASAFVCVSGLVTTSDQGEEVCLKRAPAPDFDRRPGAPLVPGEPSFSRAQVASNDGMEGRSMWMTYRGGVYDVTKFHKVHPGGHLITQVRGIVHYRPNDLTF